MLNFSMLNAINVKKHAPSELLNPIKFAIRLQLAAILLKKKKKKLITFPPASPFHAYLYWLSSFFVWFTLSPAPTPLPLPPFFFSFLCSPSTQAALPFLQSTPPNPSPLHYSL